MEPFLPDCVVFLTLNFCGVMTMPESKLPDLAPDANYFELIDDVNDGG